MIAKGIQIGGTLVSEKELDRRFDKFEIRVKREIAEAFLDVLVQARVIKKDKE